MIYSIKWAFGIRGDVRDIGRSKGPSIPSGFLIYAGTLGFGCGWHIDSDSDNLRKEEPTTVPTTDCRLQARVRSVAIGEKHVIALTDEGQVYM